MSRSIPVIIISALVFISTPGCRPCPEGVAQPTTPDQVVGAASSNEPGIPLIGVTGYVILPETRGDEGLGHFKMTRTYSEAVARAGGQAVHLVPVPLDRIGNLVERLDGLILAGGPDVDPAAYHEAQHPTVRVLPRERQEFDFALAREALQREMPILGICLGSQELNVLHGGSLIQDIPSEVDSDLNHRDLEIQAFRSGVHEITLVQGTPLAGAYGQAVIRVNSAHHQASDVMGEGLVVAARSADGVVEGFYRPGYPFLVGVQYHPEAQTEPSGLHDGLFRAFVEAASTYRASQDGL